MATISQQLAIGVEHLQKGDHEQAEKAVQEVLERDPGCADALHLLGVIAHRRGRGDRAIDYLRQAVATDPGQAEFHYNLATAYQFNGRLDEAVHCFQEALRLRPDHADASNNIGYALISLGRAAEAIPHLRSAVAVKPGFAEAHNNLGLAQAAEQLWDEAVVSLERAIQLNPAGVEARYNLNKVLLARAKVTDRDYDRSSLTQFSSSAFTQDLLADDPKTSLPSLKKTARIVYISWPAGEITGGVKMAFRHVEVLRDLGFDACLATADARPPAWFNTTAPVASLNDLSPTDDVLVLPENNADLLKRFASWRNLKVVFCQNQFQMHRGLAGRDDYSEYGVQYVMCTGSLAAAVCRRRLPRARILMLPYPLDCGLFHPRGAKKIQIAYAPRKREQEVAFIFDLYRAETLGFRAIPWVRIDQRSESEVAAVLAESALYLSLQRFESFGLSALEALASGCLVAGFTGFGGRDYATSSNGFWAPEDDCATCVDCLAEATRLLFEGGDRCRAMVADGIDSARRYNYDLFRTRLLTCWDTILGEN